jgi:O-antigen/teichoic acid export membrane protein
MTQVEIDENDTSERIKPVTNDLPDIPGTDGDEASSKQRSPRREALSKWTAILAKFVSVQIAVQALGLLTGIMLVRSLSQKEYAYFTLANTMQATLLLLADVGVGSALSSRGSLVWQDRRRFGELIQTGLQVRKRLAWIAGVVALPILCALLLRNGAGLLNALLLAAAVLLGANFRLTNDVLVVVPKMTGRIDQLQRLDVSAALFRLVTLGFACLTYVDAVVGILAASLSFGVNNVLLRKWTPQAADPLAPTNLDDRRHILQIMRQLAPNTIYFCVHSQITVFLISVFGNVTTLAELGALGRLGMLFTICTSVINNVVLPRFARCNNPDKLVRMYWTIVGAFVIVSSLLMCMVILFPTPFLAVLGHKYHGLSRQLAYVVCGSIVSTFVGLTYSLNASKGWVNNAWISMPIIIVCQLAMVPLVNLGTIQGVTLISTVPPVIGLIPVWQRAYRALQGKPPVYSRDDA